jgi:hypothetical protein
MADNPHGLNPKKHKLGVPLSATVNPYYVPATYETALFIGDPVVKSGTANTAVVAIGAEEYPIAHLPEINQGATGGNNVGVIVGKRNNVSNLEQLHNPVDTEAVMLVCDDPYVVFQAQEDSVGGNIAIASVGLNTELIFTHAGDAVTGISGAEIDSSEVAATATLAVKILRASAEIGNVIPGANAEWDIMLNVHSESHGTGSLGL